MADLTRWCGNQLPHPAHDTCHGVREPDGAEPRDGALYVVTGRKDHPHGPVRTTYGPTTETSARAVADALNHNQHAAIWEMVPVPAAIERYGLCGNLAPHPVHADCTGLSVDWPWAEMEPARPGRAVIPLSEIDIERLLGLPHGMRIVGMAYDFQRLAILLGVESPDLPRVDPAAVAPELGGRFSVETMVDENGKTWRRWHWAGEGA